MQLLQSAVGCSGTRLWPVSREPRLAFMKIAGEEPAQMRGARVCAAACRTPLCTTGVLLQTAEN